MNKKSAQRFSASLNSTPEAAAEAFLRRVGAQRLSASLNSTRWPTATCRWQPMVLNAFRHH